jgi:RNA methyltransferase, TrmH family
MLLDSLLHMPGVTFDLVEVSERVLEAVSDVQTTQGVVGVLPLNAFDPAAMRARRSSKRRSALLILDDLADPGNMGTILRTALAADVDTVLLTPACVDYLSPKVVRAAAGAHIALPVETDLSWNAIEEKIALHCAGVPRVLLAEARSEHQYFDLNLTSPFALVIGNEAHGPSHEARRRATQTITIPLLNGVESLNAAIATSIILYEAVRQSRSS